MVMPDLPFAIWAGLFAVVLVSGLIRGLTGYGFALIASPLLASMLAPVDAVKAVIMLQLGSGLIGMAPALRECLPRPTAMLVAAAVVTTPLGALVLHLIPADTMRLTIAGLTLAALAILLWGRKRPQVHGAGFAIPFGLAAGLFGGACAIPGPPVIAYFMTIASDPRTSRASMNVVFVAIGLVALATGLAGGLITPLSFIIALVTSPAMVIGTVIGGRLFGHIAPATYRRIGLVSLAVSAATAAARALF